MIFAYSSSTSYSRGYVIVWCRTNCSFRVPPLQLYKKDLMKTLIMLYTLDFEVYLSKLDIAPSSLGLSYYGKSLVVIACVKWNWDVTENLIKSTNARSDLKVILIITFNSNDCCLLCELLPCQLCTSLWEGHRNLKYGFIRPQNIQNFCGNSFLTFIGLLSVVFSFIPTNSHSHKSMRLIFVILRLQSCKHSLSPQKYT